MSIRMLIVALGACAMLSPAAAQTAGQISLKSVSVNLPNADRAFPGGHDADATKRNCLVCHSAGMLLTQPALSKAQWQAEIYKMRVVYKAPVDPKDFDAIVAYLISINAANFER